MGKLDLQKTCKFHSKKSEIFFMEIFLFKVKLYLNLKSGGVSETQYQSLLEHLKIFPKIITCIFMSRHQTWYKNHYLKKGQV